MARRKNTAEAFEVLYRRARERVSRDEESSGQAEGPTESRPASAAGRAAMEPGNHGSGAARGSGRGEPGDLVGFRPVTHRPVPQRQAARAPLRPPPILRRPASPDPVLRSRAGPQSVGRKRLRDPRAVHESSGECPPRARPPGPPAPLGGVFSGLPRPLARSDGRDCPPETRALSRREPPPPLRRWLPSESARELRREWVRDPHGRWSRTSGRQPASPYDPGDQLERWSPAPPDSPAAAPLPRGSADSPLEEFHEQWGRQTRYRPHDQDGYIRNVGDIFGNSSDRGAAWTSGEAPFDERWAARPEVPGSHRTLEDSVPEMARMQPVPEAAGLRRSDDGFSRLDEAQAGPSAGTSMDGSTPSSNGGCTGTTSSGTTSSPIPEPVAIARGGSPARESDTPSGPMPPARETASAEHPPVQSGSERRIAETGGAGEPPGGGGGATPAGEPRVPRAEDAEPGPTSAAGTGVAQPTDGTGAGPAPLGPAALGTDLDVVATLVTATRRAARWILGDGLSGLLARRIEVRVGTLVGFALATVVTCGLLIVYAQVKRESDVYGNLGDILASSERLPSAPVPAGGSNAAGQLGTGAAHGGSETAGGAGGAVVPPDAGPVEVEQRLVQALETPPMPLLGPMEDAESGPASRIESGGSVSSLSEIEAPRGRHGLPSREPGALGPEPRGFARDLEPARSGVDTKAAGSRDRGAVPLRRYYWFIRVRGMCYQEEAESVREYFETRLGYTCRLEPETRDGQQETREGRPLFAVFVDQVYADEATADRVCAELKRKARADPYEKSYMRDFEGAYAIRREVSPSPPAW